MRVFLSDLDQMSPTERDKVLAELVLEACNPRIEDVVYQILVIKNEIRLFEEKFQMVSEVMKIKIELDEIDETWEHCKWLGAIKEFERLVALRQRLLESIKAKRMY